MEILASLPGVGRMTTVAVLTEATQPLATRDYQRIADPHRHRADHQGQRQAAAGPDATRLQYAVARGRLPLGASQHPAGRADGRVYKQLRARGQTHGGALRSVIDRWLRILVAMLRHRTLYNPTRFLISVPVPA